MLPSIYLDGRIPNDKDYGVSLFEPNKSSSMKWLDSKPENSVVYVSFGSTAELGKPQMEELAEGLKLSTKSFLWVYVEDVWKVGKRVRMEEDGVCKREMIEVCINEVMEGEDSEEIKRNLVKWREVAKAAMDEGGSSDMNLKDFVKQLLGRT
ncbi:Flavonol 7-O-beta-glucosyltransferase UGT74F1, partial [Cucurbita argyrosperma subsp. sororia]